MGSQGLDEFPPITPLQTAVKEPSDAVEEDCLTPRSDNHTIKPPLVCPPAPRKRRPAKRKSGSPQQGFFAVPRDLNLVFLALPMPPKKKIRVG
ncbi:hypothetical protein MRB53_008812 [Persea americana]|uniref:Uncharacterized protein n=1 Tax=Persea americana TaxID=3435 RepID=A0ACC2LM80_PERAE|nr:hypothetical protein MRB53_008812 [Persea americana]